jgi:death-on-curing protein
MCDLNGWWIDADEDDALELVGKVGKGAVEVPRLAQHLEAWALPKQSDL